MIRCDDAGLLDDLISTGLLEPSVELCQDLMRRHGCITLPEVPHFNKVRRQGYKDDQVHGSPTNNEEHNPQPFQFGHKAPASSRCLQWLHDHERYRDVYEEAVVLYMEQEAKEHEIETILEQQKEVGRTEARAQHFLFQSRRKRGRVETDRDITPDPSIYLHDYSSTASTQQT